MRDPASVPAVSRRLSAIPSGSRRRDPAAPAAGCRRAGGRRLASTLLVWLALASVSRSAAAQSLTIPEYRELILSKESTLAQIDRDFALANARLDDLVGAKGTTGRTRSREISSELLRVSAQVTDLDRRRRTAAAELNQLRAALDDRYTRAIDANLSRLGEMAQSDSAYGPLLVETGRYITARDSIQLQIRIQETLGSFREFPILPSDGPTEIREKAGFYRDYVHDVDQKIAVIDDEIGRIQERDRVARRMQELQEDLTFQGEDVPKRPTDAAGGDLREDPTLTTPGVIELLGSDPERHVANLEQERRSLELLRRRFQDKVREYEDRARTIYSRQTTQPGDSSR